MRIPWSKLFFGTAEDKPEPYIPVDQDIIQRIKSAVALAEPGMALEILQELDIPAIEPDVLALAGRYNHLQSAQRRGIVSADEQQLQFNRLNHDMLDLTAWLEKSLEPDKGLRQVKVNLRKRYQQRLKDKLADRQPINIQCAYTIEGTDPERAKIAYDEIVLEQKAVQSNLEALFDRHRGRLLITGDPGAGKTSLLLQLADALLKRRENRVPVILNLSTWKSSYPTFDAWLLEALPQAAYVSKAMAKTLVLEDRLLPLFDGLDEVAAEHRNSCLAGIAHYGRAAAHQYVICSRSAEYADTAGAPVYGQIKVLPLTQAQIVQQLENSAQPEARFLLHALRNQPLLARVVENPFYFNTAQLLLSSMTSLEELKIRADSEEALQAGLVEQFVERQLATPARVDFPAEKSRRWLGFLAKKMAENGLVVFELTDLRLGWLGRSKWAYFISCVIFINFLVVFSFVRKKKEQELLSSITILISIIWIFFSSKNFKTLDRLWWTLSKMKEQAKSQIIPYFIGVSGIAILFLLEKNEIEINQTILTILLFLFMFFLIGMNTFSWGILFIIICIWGEFIYPLFSRNTDIKLLEGNVIIFLFIISFISRILSSGIRFKSTIYGTWPYNRIFTTSMYNVFPILILLIATIYSICIKITTTDLQWNKIDLSGLMLAIPFIPFMLAFKHLILRIILFLANCLPLQMATFLNEMTARHLFESDGGSWRFRHKIVQDYFVRRYGSR